MVYRRVKKLERKEAQAKKNTPTVDNQSFIRTPIQRLKIKKGSVNLCAKNAASCFCLLLHREKQIQ